MRLNRFWNFFLLNVFGCVLLYCELSKKKLPASTMPYNYEKKFSGSFCLHYESLRQKKKKGQSWDLKYSVGTPRTLFYEEASYIETVMDRHFWHLYCGALSVPHFRNSIAIWGPGWPGWNQSLTCAANILRKFPGGIDLVITRHNPARFRLKNTVFLTYRHECVFSEKSFYSEERWLCNWSAGVGGKGRYPWNYFNIVLLTYRNDIFELQKYFSAVHLTGLPSQVLIGHWPHAVLSGSFHLNKEIIDFKKRSFDICLIGCVDPPTIYPVRKKFHNWFQKGVFEKAGLKSRVLPHFGYTEMESKLSIQKRNISALSLEKQYDHYIDFIRDCEAVIVTRSSRDYDLRKYTEVALAGSLMVGNLPKFALEWRPYVVDIEKFIESENTTEIIGILKKWLSPAFKTRRQLKIRAAQNMVLNNRLFSQRFFYITKIYNEYKAGKRGFFD